MNNASYRNMFLVALVFCVSPVIYAAEIIEAVKLVYNEIEKGVEPYTVTYIVTGKHIRIDDASDDSGHIIFNIKENRIYSVSHYDQSILVIPQYPVNDYKPVFVIDIEYNALENAPMISGKSVYNYRVKAGMEENIETCMDIQLVPGLLPTVSSSMQAFQKTVSSKNVISLESTPDEYKKPCYLVDQVYNKGEYYSKGLPIQEWHSNGKIRQLMNYENVKVEASLFDMPDEYRRFSLKQDM